MRRLGRTLASIAAVAAIVITVLAAMLLAAILTGGHGYGG